MNALYRCCGLLLSLAIPAGLYGCYVLSRSNLPLFCTLVALLSLIAVAVVLLLYSNTRRAAEKVKAEQARSLHRLMSINRLHEVLILPVPLEEKLKQITQTAMQLLDLDFCRVWMVRPGDLCNSGCIHATANDEAHRCIHHEKCLHLLVSSGRYTHLNGNHRRVPLGCYKIGLIATDKMKKFLTNRVTKDPRVHNHEWAKSLGLVSFAGYKLRNVRDETTGVLALFSRHPLSEDDDAFIETLAEMTSKVIIQHIAEEELREVQRLEGVGQLAGSLAHEFNNLLQVIGGYTHCALEGLDPREERHQDLQQVSQATERAVTLTQQLLGFSRRRSLQPENADANQLVRDMIQSLRPAIPEHIILESELADNAGEVFADAGELQQALMNLCFNARDAMPNGGILNLKTERVLMTETRVGVQGTLLPGHYVLFSVRDTGCGIPDHVQPHIFEPFFTTKEVGKGTGMGLAALCGVVQQHRGAIRFFSEPGKGALFQVFIPAVQERTRIPDVTTSDSTDREMATILLAEDDPGVRKLAVRILENAGYDVLVAADGEEAEKLFEEHREEISLVVLDMIMPRRNGPEVYRHIRNLDRDVKVVFCTGYDSEMAHGERPECEGAPLIQKPYSVATFLRAIREALDALSADPLADRQEDLEVVLRDSAPQ